MANRKATRLGDAKFSYTVDETVVDGVTIDAGHMVERIDAGGEVQEATDAASRFVLGVSTKEVDNTDDGESANFISTAIHEMVIDGTITRSNIGDLAYVKDSATVSVSGSNNIAGPIVDVTATTVFVDFDPAKKN